MLKTALDTTDLRLGDFVQILDLKYEVREASTGFYLESIDGNRNDAIFNYVKTDKYRLQREILGYTCEFGIFPHCRTLFELTMFVRGIQYKFVSGGDKSND